MLNEQQRDYLFPRAYNAALRAGAAILDLYDGTYSSCNISLKQDCTPITEADRQSHDIIKKYLSRTRVPFLSEEGREMLYEERKGWDLFWMVDPLDGTKEFIKGNGEFTVNIALMADNRPVLSVVYVPYINRIYFGDIFSGSFIKTDIVADADADFSSDEIFDGARDLPISRSLNSPLRIAVSRSHNTAETFRHIDAVKEKFPDAETVKQGSSYKFCMLAEGSVDYYVRTTRTYEWDTAAGELVLSLAGGTVCSLHDGKPLEYNKESLTNPHFVCRSKFMPAVLRIGSAQTVPEAAG